MSGGDLGALKPNSLNISKQPLNNKISAAYITTLVKILSKILWGLAQKRKKP